ncbi:ERF family protein [Micromonospora sp. STR1s_5]|nr:ERF family protein [Micromonospora sp. STR1s_5]
MSPQSDSIAQLAAALAKAQADLVNPVKSLTGVIDRWGTGKEGQSYRYAPLSAGLDIVRKALCRHELAVIQTTHVDRNTDTVMLTTTLAHGSGEFINSLWPVCRASEMTNPKLMGAALTYARRYGLFTLVGIAGEDDLDGADPTERPSFTNSHHEPAPAGTPSPDQTLRSSSSSDAYGGDYQAGTHPNRTRKKRSDAGVPRNKREPSGPIEVATRELATLNSSEGLIDWAVRLLPLRIGLPDEGRATLDAAFLEKAEELGSDLNWTPDLNGAFAEPPSPREHSAGVPL